MGWDDRRFKASGPSRRVGVQMSNLRTCQPSVEEDHGSARSSRGALYWSLESEATNGPPSVRGPGNSRPPATDQSATTDRSNIRPWPVVVPLVADPEPKTTQKRASWCEKTN